MCGIFGGLALQGRFDEQGRRAVSALAHRGPDGEGLVSLESTLLGHRRLSIIDLSPSGDQPMWDADRRVVIVFNGEIYNFRQLRSECVAAGLRFTSASDTEVILGQYLLQGTKAFERLNGMFAFCLHDTRSGESFLVRDPFGIKPLYYAPTPLGVFFASELQVLFDIDAVDTALDRRALQAYLQLDFVPTPYSIVRGVRKLEAGSFLRVSRDASFEVRRYDSRGERVSAPGEALERFEAAMDAAVERHLVSDVPVGVFLSGGLDSSIVAETATRLLGRPVEAFSIAFDDPSFDESPHFTAVAKAIGARHRVRKLAPRAMLEMVPEVAGRMGEPLADGSIYPTLLLSRFAREHVKVVLSGDGADELFAGYPTYVAHAVARHLPAPLRSALRAASPAVHRFVPVRHENFSTDYKLKKFLEGVDGDPVTRHFRWMGTFAPEELPRLLTEYDPSAQDELARLLAAPAAGCDDWLEKLLRLDQRFYLQDGVLVKVDRASMAVGLEVRVPFLDREVVAFADSAGRKHKLRNGTTKALLRDVVARRLPASIARRPKKGFGVPLGRWFRGELRPLLESVLAPERIATQGIFRPDFVSRLLDDHWSGRRDNRKQIFNLLSFMMWCDAFRRSGCV
ncbi:MAG TPA: asparagine synthase (glutamine-hydrolyzing) [Thermoanaerobaculia bacterium]|nr:asparagine synthase (glutamine-hydrolyzing) [Thermoanaerobaculia bacterium]